MTILRTLGTRIIIYIDDILVMAPSKKLGQEHTECLVFLLENLGFTVIRQKSLTDPTQEIDFLGLVADSVLMELRLPGSKIKNIRTNAKALLQMVQPMAREVSRLLGKLTHATHSMRAAPPPPPFLQTHPSMPASCLADSAGLLPSLPSNKRGEREFELAGHSPNFMEREAHSRLHENETPYSEVQICLATVVKTQRFAFCFTQWERALTECSHCVRQNARSFSRGCVLVTFKKKMLPLEKMSLCISNCRNDLSEPTRTRRSRCRSFGFQELSSELTFRIEQSMSVT